MGKHRWPTAGDAWAPPAHPRLPTPRDQRPDPVPDAGSHALAYSLADDDSASDEYDGVRADWGPPSFDGPDDGEARSGIQWRVARSAALVFLGVALAVGAALFLVRSSEPSAAAVSVQLDAEAPAASVEGATDTGSSPAGASSSDGAGSADVDREAVDDGATGPRDGAPGDQAVGRGAGGPGETAAGAPSGTEDREGVVVIYLTGAVASPGVFTVAPGTRLVEVIDEAGGATPEADLEGINLASTVSDGQHVHLLAVGEEPRAGGTGADVPVLPADAPVKGSNGQSGALDGTARDEGGSGSAGILDINSASLAEIESLPRVGPVLGQRIIDWREEHGRFVQPGDLDAVPGIGPAMLEGILPLIEVR